MSRRILLAPDAYKGCLSAGAVATAMGAGARRVFPGAQLIDLPMADGGEGSLDLLLTARAGHPQCATLSGPDDVPQRVRWGKITAADGGETAVLEVAQLVGLSHRVSIPVQLRSSWMVGAAIRYCLELDIRHFLVCLGGSGTNDGGAGMLAALGLRFLDRKGRDVAPSLAGLADLARVDAAALDPRLRACHFDIMSDVSNPLCGAEGATAVFGIQKGVPADRVDAYDSYLHRYATLCAEVFGRDPSGSRGSGAAGGLGFALLLLGGGYRPGAAMMADVLGLDSALRQADLVMTGEGCSDAQTFCGKVASEVALRAGRARVPALLVSGRIRVDGDERWQMFEHAVAATPDDMSLSEAVANARSLIEAAAERVLRLYA